MLCAACTRGTQPAAVSPATPVEPATGARESHAIETTPPPPRIERRDFATPSLPKGLAIAGRTLVWADVVGAIWTMPVDGSSPPKQLSNQHKEGFAFYPFVAGDKVLARTKRGLFDIALPDGPVTRGEYTGLAALPEEAVADADSIYVTIFQHDDVMRLPASGGAAKHLLRAKRGVLALHGDTLYVASYTTGELFAIPTGGGSPRVIARKLAKPTAIVADDHAVYVYTETDETVSQIDPATGKLTPLAHELKNSDELALADGWLYTVSWPSRVVRIPTTPGGAVTDLAADLDSPRSIVLDDSYVYVTSSSPNRIVRLPRK